MSKIYIGSSNPVKILAVKSVAKDWDVISQEVASRVCKQPFSDQETIQGALNRAQGLPHDGLRIGLEAGVEEINNQLFLVNWGVLIDEDNQVYYAGGARLPLPQVVGDELKKTNEELAEVIDRLYQTKDIKHKEGAISIFTANEVKRIDIFIHIVKLLIGQYKAKKKED